MPDRVNAETLSTIINRCFDNAMDLRFSEKQRIEFLALGKRLRGSLVNLLSARFDAGTAALTAANTQLDQINKGLRKVTETLANAAQRLADLTKLVGSLDKLLTVATSFV